MKRFEIKDKNTREVIEVSLSIFLACFGEVPEAGTSLENDYCIGWEI